MGILAIVYIGQATRIGGVNPADVNALLVHLELRSRSFLDINPVGGASRNKNRKATKKLLDHI